MGMTIPPAGAAARATGCRLREWWQLRALSRIAFWTALFSGGIRTCVVCQKDGPIIAATSVFFLASRSLGRFETWTRGVYQMVPPPPPPWSFKIIELEGKFL